MLRQVADAVQENGSATYVGLTASYQRPSTPIERANPLHHSPPDRDARRLKHVVRRPRAQEERNPGEPSESPSRRHAFFSLASQSNTLVRKFYNECNTTHKRAFTYRSASLPPSASTRTRNGATYRKLWSPSKGVVSPAVARVRTQTANTGATSGSSHVMSSRR